MIGNRLGARMKPIGSRASSPCSRPTHDLSKHSRFLYLEALLHEGKIRFGENTISHYHQLSQALGAVTPEKLAASPLNDNVQYLRFMVDPRLAEGKRAEFNVIFTDEKVSYAIALSGDAAGWGPG